MSFLISILFIPRLFAALPEICSGAAKFIIQILSYGAGGLKGACDISCHLFDGDIAQHRRSSRPLLFFSKGQAKIYWLFVFALWAAVISIAAFQGTNLTGFASANDHQKISVYADETSSINLADYFSNASDRAYLALGATDFDVVFEAGIMNITPYSGFTGSQKIDITGIVQEDIEQKSFMINVLKKELLIRPPENETIPEQPPENETPPDLPPIETPPPVFSIPENETIIPPNITENETLPTPLLNLTQPIEEQERIWDKNVVKIGKKKLGVKIDDDLLFDVNFTDIMLDNDTLTLVFYHNSTKDERVYVNISSEHDISTNLAVPFDNVTLEVTLDDGIVPEFELHVGDASEIFKFGKKIPKLYLNDKEVLKKTKKDKDKKEKDKKNETENETVEDTVEYEIIDRDDEFVDVRITKANASVYISGINAPSINALFNWISNAVITTEIFAAEPIEMESATITLPRVDDVTAVVECSNFDFTLKDCVGDWIAAGVPFNLTDVNVSFTVTHFSGYGGGDIAVINVQSYPMVYDNWTVEFNTSGTADLIITPENGTTWTDYAERDYDLRFLELRCGNEVLNYSFADNSVVVENYSCSQVGYETSRVLTKGEHTLEFRFGDDVDYAHNLAGIQRVVTEGMKYDFRTTNNSSVFDPEYFGYAVGFGDINGDGYDDVLISAPGNNDNGNNTGKIYLFYGPLSKQFLNTSDANASFYGEAVNSTLGHFTIGDFNNDGKDDILTGTVTYPTSYVTDGRAYLVYGRYLTGNMNISVAANVTWTAEWVGCNDALGSSTADAGDVNNDGYQDMLISAENLGACDPTVDTAGGKVYLLYGQSAPLTGGTISTKANASFYGNGAFSYFEASDPQHRKGGDFNGDGYDDMVFSARNCFGTCVSGELPRTYIVFGKAWSGNNNISVVRNASWFRTTFENHGFGDINTDGKDDLILGGTDANYWSATVLIYGSNAWNSDYNLSNANTYNASWTGGVNFMRGESAVASGYDYNNDSQIDFLIGTAPWDLYSWEQNRGLLEIWSGRNFTYTSSTSNYTQWYGQGQGYTETDYLAYSLDFGGDTNNDGIIEVLAGAIIANDTRGAAYLLYNTRPVLSSVNLTSQYGTNYSNESLYCRGNVSDAEDVYLDAEYRWYKNGVLYSSGNANTVANGTNTFINTLPAGTTHAYEVWNCELRFFDGWLYSSYVNSSSMTINYFPPTQTKPVLTSTDGTNRLSQNLTVNPFVTSSLVFTNITNWYRNGSSYAVLNMPFDTNSASTAKDYSAYNNTGAVNSATWTSSGISGGAYSFDGVNDYINATNNTILDGMSRLTIEFWMKANTLDDWAKPVSKFNWLGYSNASYYCQVSNTDAMDCGVYNEIGVGYAAVSTNALSTGSWYHIVAVMNGTHVVLYINGAYNSSTAFTGNSVYNSEWPVLIGATLIAGSPTTSLFNGTIDEVRIYDRALTPQQILADYNSGLSRYDRIVNQELARADVWYAENTANDAYNETSTLMSNGLQITTAPTQNNPGLTGGYDTNLTVVPLNVVDIDGDPVVNVPNWYRNATSITLLNMPFNGLLNRHSVADSNTVLAMYFENNMKDFSGNNYDGTCSNCPAYTASGKVDGAYNYDNSNDAITIPYTSNLAFVGQNFTIAAWIYMDAEQDNWLGSIFSKSTGSSTATNGYVFSVRGNSDGTNKGKLWINIMDAAGFSEGPGNTVLAVGKWYHAVVTYNSASKVANFYLNGIADGSFTSTKDVTDSGVTSVTQVGRGIDTNAYVFDGSIDELHIFNRILTDSEIRYLYKKGAPPTVIDYSPHGNDGNVIGAAYTSSGISGGAYSFDGINDYLDVSNDSSLNPTAAVTVEAWIKVNSNTGNPQIIARKMCGGTGGYAIRVNSTGNGFESFIYNSTGNLAYAGPATKALSPNVWYYVAMTYDSSGRFITYVNGTVDQNISAIGSLGVDPGSVGIGAYPNTCPSSGWTEYFNGTIDEVRIYNRSLTSQQILADYNAGAPIYRKIVLEEQSAFDIWRADLTPNDGYLDGLTKPSNNVTINQSYPNCTGATAGGILIIDSTRTITNDLICKVITVTNNAILYVNSTAKGNVSVLIQAEELTVDAGSQINSTGYGYRGGLSGYGSGPGGSYGGAVSQSTGGGGYGGKGGDGATAGRTGGNWYNSSFQPLEQGSGAGGLDVSGTCVGGVGSTCRGGNGGGAFVINATTFLIVNGKIVSDGTDGVGSGNQWATGGGAGGTIKIHAYNLTGTGSLSAVGGKGYDGAGVGGAEGGGGGGGRIIVYYSVTDWSESNVVSRTNVFGGFGPDAALDGEVGTLAFINVVNNNVFVTDGFRWQLNDLSTNGAWFSWPNITILDANISTNITNLTLNVTGVLNVTNSTWVNNNTVNSTFNLNLSYFNNATLLCGNYTNFNGVSLSFDANSVVNATGSGYGSNATSYNGYGPGGGLGAASQGAGGAAHGGNGGKGSNYAAGYWYDSSFSPVEMGSGAGSSGSYLGGSGGGSVIINATNVFLLNGKIVSDGTNGTGTGNQYASGGGAGGTIKVQTYNLTGTGNLSAAGGIGFETTSADGGGGGGGRIIVYYNVSDWSQSNMASRTSVLGGIGGNTAGNGGAGTLAFINLANNNMYSTDGFRWQLNDLSINSSWFSWSNITILDAAISTNISNLTLNASEVLNVANSTWLCGNNTNLNVRDFLFDSYSILNATGSGYAGGTATTINGSGPSGGRGNASSANLGGAGGGHGGWGGDGGYAGTKTTYSNRLWDDSSFLPLNPGSGGGVGGNAAGYGNGGSGGGAVRINATLLVLNGSVVADGVAGFGNFTGSYYAGGGGAGGSVYVTSYNLTGVGSISAKGGDGGNANNIYGGGGGGGGRIAVYYNVTNWTSADFLKTKVTAGINLTAPGGASAGSVGTAAFVDVDDNNIFIPEGFRWQQNDLSANALWFSWVNAAAYSAAVSTHLYNFSLNVSKVLNVTNSTWTNLVTNITTFNFSVSPENVYFTNSSYYGGNYSAVNSVYSSLFVNSTLFGGNYLTLNSVNITFDSNSKINSTGSGYAGGTATTINGSGPGGGEGTASYGGGGGGGGGSGGNGYYLRGGYWYNSSFEPLGMGSGGGYSAYDGSVGGNGGGAVKIVAANLLILNSNIDVNANGPSGGSYGTGWAGGGAGGSIYINAYNLTGSGTLLAKGGTGGMYYGGGGGGGRIIVYYNTTNWTMSDFNRISVSGGALGASPQTGVQAGEVGTLAFINRVVDEVFSLQGFRFQLNDMSGGQILHNSFNMTNASVRVNESGVVVEAVSSFNLYNSNLTNENSSAVSFFKASSILFDPTSRIYFTGRLDLTFNTFTDTNATYGVCRALTLEKTATSEIAWINSSLTNLFNLSTNVLLGQNFAHVNSSKVSGLNTTANITFWGLSFVDPKAIWSVNDNGVFVDCPSAQCKKISYSGGTFKFNVTRFTNYSTNDNFTLSCGLTITTDITMSQNLSSNGTCITIGADNITFNCEGYVLTGNQTGAGVYSNGYSNFTIKNCRITNFSNGLDVRYGANALLLNNTMWLNVQNGTLVNFMNHTRFLNNTGYNNSNYGFACAATCVNDTFISNRADNNTATGFDLICNNCNISYNNASSNSLHGINLGANSQYSVLSNNIANGNAQRNFFLGGSSKYNNLTNNIAYNAPLGIYFGLNVNYNYLYGNIVENHSQYGITLQLNSSNNTFVSNRVYNSTLYNIYLSPAHNNTFNNSNLTLGPGISVSADSQNNSFFNTTIDNATTGISNAGHNTTFNATTIFATSTWIYDNDTADNYTNTTFTNTNGSINIVPTVAMPAAASVTLAKLNITFNKAFLNSSNLSFFNTSGIITLKGLSFINPFAVVDFFDRNNLSRCSGSICVNISYSSGTFIYNVTHFTMYGSKENSTPDVIFVLQVPPDISSTNVIGTPLNITYNISDFFNGIDNSTVELSYKTNSTTSDCWTYVNGSIGTCGYQNISYDYVTGTNYSFSLYDNQIYPGTYNFPERPLELTYHNITNLTNNNELIKIQLLNVSNTSQYGFYEIMANTSGTGNLRVYYCNSSYTSGPVQTSTFCTNFYNMPASGTYNHSHSNYSKHQVAPFAMNSSSGTLGTVRVTSTSYFIVRGVTGTTWHIYYISNISRTNAIQTSANSGAAWSNFAGTVDSHLHQYQGNDTFWYYACANNTIENRNCSAERYDYINLTGIPPTAPDVYSPTNTTYYTTIPINYTAAVSPNGYNISFYNISLMNADNTFNKTLVTNNSLNLGYLWNRAGTDDGFYIIRVQACDVLNQCSFGYSELFELGFDCGNITTSKNLTRNIEVNGTCFNITADNMTFDCSGYNLTGNNTGYGFYVPNRKNVTIENCRISNFTTAIYSSSSNNSLYRNDTMWINQFGIHLNPSYNNTILNNTAYNNSLDGLHLDNSHNNTIANNTAFNNTRVGFYLNLSTFNRLTNNTAHNNSVTGFRADASSNNTFVNSAAIDNAFYGFLIAYTSGSNNLTNNTVYNNGQYGFYLYSSSDSNILSNNTAYKNGEGFRISLNNINNVIANNTVYNNSYGITVYSATNNDFVSNFVQNDTLTGIYIDAFSYNNTFTDNQVYDDAISGVYLGGLDNKLNRTTIRSAATWMYTDTSSTGNNVTYTTFTNPNGSITIVPSIVIPVKTIINTTNLNISFNLSFLNSTNISFFNTTGIITLRGLNLTNPDPIVDFNDTLNFTLCNGTICTEISYLSGVFIYNVTRFTQYSSKEGMTLDLTMPKDTVNCTVTLYQGNDTATLYTCGDVPSVGGSIVCDADLGGSSATNPTNSTTCDLNAPNYGAFFITNNGVDANLNATLVNLTINGINNTNIYLDNYIFDAVSAPGCNNTNCNNCPAADTAGCYKDLNSTTPDTDTVQECDRFTSGGSLCECVSIHIEIDDDVHELKNGGTLTFQLQKTVALPAQNPCT